MTPERIEQLYALLKRANFSPQLFHDEEVEALRDLALKGLQAEEMREDTARLDWLQDQLKYGWGDGFAMQPLDSGAQYVRPWRSALQRTKGFELIAWWETVRDAIDSARDLEQALNERKET